MGWARLPSANYFTKKRPCRGRNCLDPNRRPQADSASFHVQPHRRAGFHTAFKLHGFITTPGPAVRFARQRPPLQPPSRPSRPFCQTAPAAPASVPATPPSRRHAASAPLAYSFFFLTSLRRKNSSRSFSSRSASICFLMASYLGIWIFSRALARFSVLSASRRRASTADWWAAI